MPQTEAVEVYGVLRHKTGVLCSDMCDEELQMKQRPQCYYMTDAGAIL